MYLCSVVFLVCCIDAYANIYFTESKQHKCVRGHESFAGVHFDSVSRCRASLLLHTTCVHLCCNWVADCVAA